MAAKIERIRQPISYMKKIFKKKGKVLTTFLRGLDRRKLRGLDGFAKALHKDAFKKIDCLDCANCCKTMSPTYTKTDVKRIAKHLGMSYPEFFDKWLYYEEKDIMNRSTPCQFLRKDNKCSVYPVRPKDCSGFPHTQNREWSQFAHGTHKQNIEYCPITMNIVERMHEKIIGQGKKVLSAKDA